MSHVKTLEGFADFVEHGGEVPVDEYVAVSIRAVLEERARLVSDQEIKYVKLAKLEEQNERLRAADLEVEGDALQQENERLRAMLDIANNKLVYCGEVHDKQQANYDEVLTMLGDEVKRHESTREENERLENAHGTFFRDCACAGCHVDVPGCWETPMCRPCATEECEHEEGKR